MRYKYLITIEILNFYEIYEIVEQISNVITSKKKAMIDLYEKKLLKIIRTRNTKIALKFVMKNQSKSYTQKSKSIFVDRIERYRSQQQQKSENTMQKNILNENNQSCEIVIAITVRISKLKNSSNVVSENKLIQSYIDTNFSNSNVSILNNIRQEFQTISHFDSYIFENRITLSSQLESSFDFVFNKQVIRSEESIEMKKSKKIYVFKQSK